MHAGLTLTQSACSARFEVASQIAAMPFPPDRVVANYPFSLYKPAEKVKYYLP